MNPDQLAQQAYELGPEGLLQMLTKLDEVLQSEAGISVQDLVDQMGGGQDQQQQMPAEEEMPMVQPEAETTFAPGGGEMAMAAGGRQRLVMR